LLETLFTGQKLQPIKHVQKLMLTYCPRIAAGS